LTGRPLNNKPEKKLSECYGFCLFGILGVACFITLPAFLAEFMVGGLLSSKKCFLFYYALYPDLEEKMLFDLREMFASLPVK
jgi:hypothetical protein